MVAIVMVLLVVGIARNLGRHDALVQWRTELEAMTGSPPWPEWLQGWPDLPTPRQRQVGGDLRGPYAYAATHSEALKHIPCYCGCGAEGHRSNLHCYVSEFRRDGVPVWTNHSFNCEMCVHIAREVMLMSSQGISLVDIRRTIDERYGSGFRRPTNTPFPTDMGKER